MIHPLQIIPLSNIGEITAKTDIGKTIFGVLHKEHITVQDNDIFVVTQKIVSKAEDRIVNLSTITPSAFAIEIAHKFNKDAEHIELVLRESKRIVRMDHGVIISETQQGFICANAGVDESNVGNKKTATLLPVDPDASAKRIYNSLVAQTKIKHLAVIISDTWGRPWREGQVNFAVGVHGMQPIIDYRGKKDSYGFRMQASMIAVADELASAAELVMGKTDQIPAVLIRGYHFDKKAGSVKELLRDPKFDMFR